MAKTASLNHVVIVESEADRAWAESAGTAITPREYVTHPERYGSRQTRVVNLSGDLDYMDMGYYCSLLAEARRQRVVPSVDTILALSKRTLYTVELPDLNAVLRKEIERLSQPPRAAFTLTICFGRSADTRFQTFARQVFDRFRSPLLRVKVAFEDRWQIKGLEAVAPSALSPEEFEFFLSTLEHHTRADWRRPKARRAARYTLAILYDPGEKLPPSSPETLKKFATLAPQHGLDVEMIQRRDYLRLAEFDALFIRETTNIDNHTYRFAKKAVHEGIVVLDDPVSILRCTNKVYLAELLQTNKLPAPRTLILDRESLLQAEQLGYPLVLKIPDGSFSRGVVKAEDRPQLLDHAKKLFKRSAVILAQQFMYTEFDWRVGVLGRRPLFASQYFMSRKHWQIINHGPDGRVAEGRFKTYSVEETPQQVLDTALAAANLIGDGLYGVDLKQNAEGVFIIEINDNPNLDKGVEDAFLKDELYHIILKDFVRRIEAR